jgi:hypothetical protein
MDNYEAACRHYAREQMPAVPLDFLDALPLDGDPADGPTLAQTGGFCMVIECGTRGMGQPEDDGVTFSVEDLDADGDVVNVYRGTVWADALAILEGGDS